MTTTTTRPHQAAAELVEALRQSAELLREIADAIAQHTYTAEQARWDADALAVVNLPAALATYAAAQPC